MSLAGSSKLLPKSKRHPFLGHRGAAFGAMFHAPNMRMIERAAILELFVVVLSESGTHKDMAHSKHLPAEHRPTLDKYGIQVFLH